MFKDDGQEQWTRGGKFLAFLAVIVIALFVMMAWDVPRLYVEERAQMLAASEEEEACDRSAEHARVASAHARAGELHSMCSALARTLEPTAENLSGCSGRFPVINQAFTCLALRGNAHELEEWTLRSAPAIVEACEHDEACKVQHPDAHR